MANRLEDWGNDLYTGRKSYKIVQKRKTLYIISGALVALALLSMLVFHFNLGIEFRGGSEFTISGVQTQDEKPAIDVVHEQNASEEPKIMKVGSNTIKVETESVTDEKKLDDMKNAFAKAYSIDVKDVAVNSIGASWGASVSMSALRALVIFLVVVMFFMAIYFRNMRMSLAAIMALFHDLIITVGVYAATGWEITPASMIGFLTILGYSMYDTVVVFDKVRENTQGFHEKTRSTYEELCNLAVNQTLVRSINTSIVALLPVGSILFVGTVFMGPGTLRDIALALFVGMFVGTYSSIFLATPLNVSFRMREKSVKEHTEAVLEKRRKIYADSGIEDLDAADISVVPSVQLLPGKHLGNRRKKVTKAKR